VIFCDSVEADIYSPGLPPGCGSVLFVEHLGECKKRQRRGDLQDALR